MSTSDDELFGDEHVRAYRKTDGARGYHWRGTTILLLTTTGRSSGEPRTTPLIHIVDGDRYVVIASKGGAPEDPDWFANMQADPMAEVQVQADRVPVTMSVAEGDERAQLWDAMVQVWPAYVEYAEKTDRQIPVVVLTPR